MRCYNQIKKIERYTLRENMRRKFEMKAIERNIFRK
jgi:hypothetical protein